MKRTFLMLLTFLMAILPALSESNDSRTVTKTHNVGRRYKSTSLTLYVGDDNYAVTIIGKNKIPYKVSSPGLSNFANREKAECAPLIREDRVWEYVDNDGGYDYRVIRMKFDGTKEIDGKTYHILNSIYAQGKEVVKQNDENVGVCKTTTPIAYMREENGKVWMRRDAASDNVVKFLGGFFGGINLYNTQGIIGSSEQDYLIYDFSANEGDIVNTLDLFEKPEAECENYGNLMGVEKWEVDATIVPGDTYKGDPDFLKEYGVDGDTYDIYCVVKNYKLYDWCEKEKCGRENMKDWEYTVSKVTDLIMDNQNKMIDSPDYHGTLKQQKTCWFDAVEGVGCIEGGTLCFPGTHFWWYGDWGSAMYLNRVYDTKGNIVFENPIPGKKIIETNVDFSGVENVNSEGYILYRKGEIIANGNGTIGISLFAANGTAVASRSGENEVTLSTANLPAGVYVAVIKSGNSTETKKILVK